MIINALYQYYQRLLEDPTSGVPRPGYNMARISFALNLSPEGELLDIIDLRVTEGKDYCPGIWKFQRGSGGHPTFLPIICGIMQTISLALTLKGSQRGLKSVLLALSNSTLPS